MNDNQEIIYPFVTIWPIMTMHKKHFDMLVVTLLFIFFIVFLIILILLGKHSHKHMTVSDEYLSEKYFELNEHSGYGKLEFKGQLAERHFKINNSGSYYKYETACLNAQNTYWDSGSQKCKCIPPYIGEKCNREGYFFTYDSIGNPDKSLLDYNIIETIQATGNAYNNNPGNVGSCGYYCENNLDCIGYIYENNGNCELISGIIKTEEIIPFSHDIDSTLFIKENKLLNLQISDLVILYGGNINRRYWLNINKQVYTTLALKPNTIVSFTFQFFNIYNRNNLIGIYCLHKFTLENIPLMLQYPHNNTYIHYPNTNLTIPWSNENMYVCYYDPNLINNLN